jgi:hypothetical protein
MLSPFFKKTKPDLLRRLNRTAARGELRYWVAVLGRAARYGDMVGDRITPENVQQLTQDL